MSKATDMEAIPKKNSAQPQQSNQIIGKSMWLITKAEVRYEGVLSDVDRVNKTMSLRDCKKMGTEGRRNGTNEIPSDDTILGNVKFKVDLIKTFKIIEKPQQEQEAPQDEPEMDPAIVQTDISSKENQIDQTPDSQIDSQQQKAKGESSNSWQKGTKVVKQEPKEDGEEPKQKQPERKETRNNNVQQPKKIVERGSNETFSQNVDKDAGDFDFKNRELRNPQDNEDNNEAKENGENETKEQQQIQKQDSSAGQKSKYDKNTDFFDNITNSTLEPLPRRGNFRGNRGDRGGRGGYRGNNERGGGYRGRGRGNNYYKNDDSNTEGNWSRKRGNFTGGDRDDFSRRGGYEGKKYSDKLQDPNDPNYYGKGDDKDAEGQRNDAFFDKPRSRGGYDRGRFRGERGGFERGGFERGGFERGGYERGGYERGGHDRGGHERGGYERGGYHRGRGGNDRPQTAGRGSRRGGFINQDKRDEETFGEFSSQNFKFSHENKKGGQNKGQNSKFNQKDSGHGIFGKGIGQNNNKYPKENDSDEDNGFYDQKKKTAQSQRQNNRFAGIDSKKKREKKEVDNDSDNDNADQN